MVDAHAPKDTHLTPGVPPDPADRSMMCSRAINGWLDDSARVARFPMMKYNSTDPIQQVDRADFDDLPALREVSYSEAEQSDADPQHARTNMDKVCDAAAAANTLLGASGVQYQMLSFGDLEMHVDSAVPMQAMLSYDPNCEVQGCSLVPENPLSLAADRHECANDLADNLFYAGK